MKKMRCFLATFALIMSLSGIPLLQGVGVGTLAHTAPGWQANTYHVTTALHMKPYGPCPGGGTMDC